ncbi:MAG: hypothetical protein AAF999_16905 [Pseudomonadota bacterium]
MTNLGRALIVILVALLCGCAAPPKTVTQTQIDGLAQQISGLGTGVDPEEAGLAAQIAYTYSLQLAEEYNVTDNPIIHNAKVNNGLRERGICVHWAEDIEKRLNAEGFKTLEVHRAIAEGNEFRIDHSTAIISRRGDSIEEGIVLDPWRYGGLLYWAPTLEDSKYFWEPQMEVLHRKYQRRLKARQG